MISIVIPARDDDIQIFTRTLESLNNQKVKPKEIILVDSSSNNAVKTAFDEFDSGNIGPNGTSGAHAFSAAADEILVGVDNSKGAFVRAIAQDSDTGDTFTTQPDDQFTQRNERIGFYGSLEEGRVCIDARAIVGLTV